MKNEKTLAMTSTQNMGNDTLHDNLKTRLQGCKGGKLEPNGERREGALWPVPRIAFSVTLCHTGGQDWGNDPSIMWYHLGPFLALDHSKTIDPLGPNLTHSCHSSARLALCGEARLAKSGEKIHLRKAT